jgi:low temperature requirement protein LtrA
MLESMTTRDAGTRSIVSPEDQSVTFVELFFDLLFVFSVTQVAHLLSHRLDWTGVGQAVLVFWLVWWAWTQFTWALNAADTTHTWVKLGTLLATGVAFFMAVALPGAFGDDAIWFAAPYAAIRVIGLAMYIWVTSVADPSQHAAVRRFAFMSVFGLAAVLAGAVAGPTALYWLWGLAILLDIVAALVAADAEGWNLHPDHFAERHGLFVIIALGESLIVAGAGLVGVEITPSVLAIGALTMALSCALWWSYFGAAKSILDRELESAEGADQSKLARDGFSLLHFPMILGVVGVAVALEAIVRHPADPLDLANRLTLALGVALFTGIMGLTLWRATGQLPVVRLLLAAGTAIGVLAGGGIPPVLTLAIAFGGVAVLAALEHRSHVRGAPLDL